MSALPNAAAQAAAVTAVTRGRLLHGLLPVHRMPIRLLSSVVTVDAAGWFGKVCVEPLLSTRAASALVTRLVCAGYVEALNVTPGNICDTNAGVFIIVLQY